jgi:anti-anti-sigma factor
MATWVGLREVGDVAIVSVVGRLTISEGSQDLRQKVHEAVARGLRHLLLNLSEVPYLDSAGIGEVVASMKVVERRGGRMKLLQPGKAVRNTLRMIKLDDVLQSIDDEAEALRSFEN